MNIARISVTRPVAVTMRIASLVLLGIVCFYKLPVDLLPTISLPTVAVITTWPNVAPEQMETQITRPIEQAVNSAPNIYQVSSSTTTGSSVVRVQFNWGTDIGQGAVDVLQLVERARQSFPTDPTLQTPIVFKYDPSQLPILIYAVTGDSNPVDLRTILDNNISPILESANGVASAVATGGEQRAIIVDVNPVKMRAYNLSLDAVSKAIVAQNLDLPAGIAKEGETEFTIRAEGYLHGMNQIANLPIGTHNGDLILLKQIATVKDSHQETRLYTRLNGKPAAGMIIVKQSTSNTVQTAENVASKIKQVEHIYPNLKFHLVYDQSQFIKDSVNDVKMSAVVGGILAALILLLFLRSFRSTMVVSLSIPISIISTFTIFYLYGFSINTFSLSGLSLATGLIVDDAVVVLENIFRHIERYKMRPVEAAVSATTEITSAVVSSTFTVMIVFLPLFLLNGQAGELFRQFALVVIISLSISLLDALTVIPMLASRIINRKEIENLSHHGYASGSGQQNIPKSSSDRKGLIQRIFDWTGDQLDALDRSYHNGLKWALHHRFIVLLGAVAVSGATFLLVPFISVEALPQTDSGNLNVTIKLPVGTALAVTNATMKRVDSIIDMNPNVAAVFSAAGTTLNLRGSTTSLASYEGACQVRLKDNRKETTIQVVQQLQKKLSMLPGVHAIVYPYDLVTLIINGGSSNMELDIYGDDLTQLSKTANQVLLQARKIPGFESADLNVQENTPELDWKVDHQKMLSLGITYQDIANTLDSATNGQLSSYYQSGGFQYPIYVQEPRAFRKSISSLLTLPVTPSISPTNPDGTARYVELGQIAKPYIALGPNEITRQNNQRYIAISGVVTGQPESEVQNALTKLMAKEHLPSGMYWTFGPQQLRQQQEYGGLTVAVLLAIALIYMLLATQFESFLYPLSILMSVPLCAIGVAIALFVTNRSFGLTAFIGMLMLIGIAVKNGILLVDYTNQLRRRGIPRDEAILTAGPTRLRPILMTASAAVLGMLPLALGIARGSETQAPLATSVIGGLTTSTLLTLFVVPVVYTILDDLSKRFYKDYKDLAPAEGVEPSLEAIETMPQISEP